MNAPAGSPYPVVFFGTPEFCVPCVEALAQSPAFCLLAAVTQPDKPAGRGQKLAAPAVKSAAAALGVPVFQPVSLRALTLAEEAGRRVLRGEKSSAALADFLNRQQAAAYVTCAYGKILPASLLQMPPGGMINVHPSLLPRWRGAAPLQRAIFEGDGKTGISIMQVDEGLDTGPVYASLETPLAPEETIGSLHDRLAAAGAELLVQVLPDILCGKLRAIPQDESKATYAEKWEEHDVSIDWEEPAERTLRRIRACCPYPGARIKYGESLVKVFRAHSASGAGLPPAEPGTIVEVNKAELIVACGKGGYIGIDEMQFPGKNRLSIMELLRGRSFPAGSRFESPRKELE